ncbi:hypothetical protein [Dokdonia sp.]|uniref:hypothetical protein n=1 Tax=Dokdonia sp. TaxID=2024995 RepID=UPI003264C5F7
MANFKGICYQPFPPGYNPSTANKTCIFFGSDIAYDPMEPIWGNAYTSSTGSSCNLTGPNKARNDIQTLRDMGVQLIRLYDWEPRNNHLKFLDYCNAHNIKVLVPVSNYFLKPGEGLPNRKTLIHSLIDSFSNAGKTDYHSAIEGIIIGNEPRLNGFDAQNCIDFTTDWATIEASTYSGYRELQIGHPVDFATYGGQYPCFGFWDPLFAALDKVTAKNLNKRLFLAPQTYNNEDYLFTNAEGSGKGYVDLAYDAYKKPILFTEIGYGRNNSGYEAFVDGQLSGSIAYHTQNPSKLIGLCYFQFADKVWLSKGDSEAMFGAYSHAGGTECTIDYGDKDFTHWDNGSCDGSSMTVDTLAKTPLYDVVVKNYT